MGASRNGTFITTALEALLLAAIVAVAIYGVVRPAIGPAGFRLGSGPVFGAAPSVEATLDGGTVQIRTIPDLPTLDGTVEPGDGMEFLVPTRTRVVVYVPDLAQRLGFAGVPVLTGLLSIAVLTLLLKITRTLRDGDPFVTVNARRLYVIAGLVGIGGLLVTSLDAWTRWQVLTHPDLRPYVVLEPHVTLIPLAAGLGIAVAAEVFRQGSRLRDEVEGLV